MPVGLVLYWWQRLITFGFSRVSVNNYIYFAYYTTNSTENDIQVQTVLEHSVSILQGLQTKHKLVCIPVYNTCWQDSQKNLDYNKIFMSEKIIPGSDQNMRILNLLSSQIFITSSCVIIPSI